MAKEEYNYVYPQPCQDDIDKWLFKEFGIMAGACSSVKELEYDVARKVAERAMEFAKEQMTAKAFDFTKEHNTACVLASECLRGNGWFSRERDFNDLFRHLSCVDELFEGKFSGKTKVIVIKED